MAQYEKVFTKPYEDGYEDLPSQNTPITASTLNDKDAAIEHIENFLDGKEVVAPTDISLWNNVQNLYQYALVDKVAQINTNVEGSVPDIAVRNYAAGEYFIQQKQLCRALTDISQGDTLTKDSNYEEVTVTDDLYSKDITNDLTWNTTNLSFTHKSVIRYGNLITINLRFTVLSTTANLAIIIDIPSELMPLNGWYFGQVFGQWNGSNVGNVIFNLGGHNNLYAPESSGYTVNESYTASFTYICKGV